MRYVQFQVNDLEKGLGPLYVSAMGTLMRYYRVSSKYLVDDSNATVRT